MDQGSARMLVQVDPLADADAEELAELAVQLRELLLDLDVEQVDFAEAGEPPPGAKAVDVIAIGSLIVSITSSWQRLHALVSAVKSWVYVHNARSVKIVLDGDVLEVSGMSTLEQRQLIGLWLARHATATPGQPE